jgi:hypothetical protein
MSINVVAENAIPGTYTLQQMLPGSPTGDMSVAGFCRSPSKNIGETIQFSVDGPATVIRIFRMGYYNGINFREVDTIVNTPTTQPAPTVIPNSNGATSASNWSVTAEWDIPLTAVSGIYFAMIRNAANNDAFYAGPFVVRDDSAEADIIYKTSDATWGSAYNYYGTKATPRGKNFYGIGGVGNIMERAYAASYHRPILTRGEVIQTYIWACELPLVAFLERNGYSVKYITSVDLDQQGVSILNNGKIFLSSGHDEYWSQNMWDAAESFRDDTGGHSIFMSGNEVFWRTRFEYDGDEVIQWCYKDTMPGPAGVTRNPGEPLDPVTWTGTWIDTRWVGGTPTEELTNTRFGMNGVYDYDAIVPWSNHKVWWASPLHDLPMASLTIPQVIGFEADHLTQVGPDESFRVLANYTRSAPGGLSDANGQRYDIPGNIEWGIGSRRFESGAVTVGFGTCQWAWSLDTTHERGFGVPANDSARQFTINLLNDLGAAPGTLMAGRSLLPVNSLNEYGLIPGAEPPSDSRWEDAAGNTLTPYLLDGDTLVPLDTVL